MTVQKASEYECPLCGSLNTGIEFRDHTNQKDYLCGKSCGRFTVFGSAQPFIPGCWNHTSKYLKKEDLGKVCQWIERQHEQGLDNPGITRDVLVEIIPQLNA